MDPLTLTPVKEATDPNSKYRSGAGDFLNAPVKINVLNPASRGKESQAHLLIDLSSLLKKLI
jgi:hypothetical protein